MRRLPALVVERAVLRFIRWFVFGLLFNSAFSRDCGDEPHSPRSNWQTVSFAPHLVGGGSVLISIGSSYKSMMFRISDQYSFLTFYKAKISSLAEVGRGEAGFTSTSSQRRRSVRSRFSEAISPFLLQNTILFTDEEFLF